MATPYTVKIEENKWQKSLFYYKNTKKSQNLLALTLDEC